LSKVSEPVKAFAAVPYILVKPAAVPYRGAAKPADIQAQKSRSLSDAAF
jgi:hypothetical protein